MGMNQTFNRLARGMGAIDVTGAGRPQYTVGGITSYQLPDGSWSPVGTYHGIYWLGDQCRLQGGVDPATIGGPSADLVTALKEMGCPNLPTSPVWQPIGGQVQTQPGQVRPSSVNVVASAPRTQATREQATTTPQQPGASGSQTAGSPGPVPSLIRSDRVILEAPESGGGIPAWALLAAAGLVVFLAVNR